MLQMSRVYHFHLSLSAFCVRSNLMCVIIVMQFHAALSSSDRLNAPGCTYTFYFFFESDLREMFFFPCSWKYLSNTERAATREMLDIGVKRSHDLIQMNDHFCRVWMHSNIPVDPFGGRCSILVVYRESSSLNIYMKCFHNSMFLLLFLSLVQRATDEKDNFTFSAKIISNWFCFFK